MNSNDTLDAYFAKYLNKTDSDKCVVYYFCRGWGGIGDYIKFMIGALHLCIQNNIYMYVHCTDIISEYIQLIPDIMITTEQFNLIQSKSVEISGNELGQLGNSCAQYCIVKPGTFYDIDKQILEYCRQYDLNCIFKFSDVITKNAEQFTLNFPYIAFHLRLGDKHLETDMNFVACRYDSRSYDEVAIFNHIEEQHKSGKSILFLSDNKQYKDKVKIKYPFVQVTHFAVGHTSLSNTNIDDFINAVTEFYLLTKAQHIFICSLSGFSLIASCFGNINTTLI